MYTVLNYIQPFEGNQEADVAPGENEFDTPGNSLIVLLINKLTQNCIKKNLPDKFI